MTEERISNEDLGALGEAHFALLCASAGLVANKSDRDQMGWDYLVERRPRNDPSVTLDHRLPATTCRVQVKTIWTREGGRVSLTLSAAERLVKTGDASFIFVVEVEDRADGPTPVSSMLLHVRGEHLTRILERLRGASLEPDAKPLNKQEITFDVGAGKPVIGGRDLSRSIEEFGGSDAKAYSEGKHAEIEGAGFDGARFKLDFSMVVADADEAADFLLGRRQVELVDMETCELRFGLESKVDHVQVPAGHRLFATVKPGNQRDCTIVVRGLAGHRPAHFRGLYHCLPIPNLPDEKQRYFFAMGVFELEVRGDGIVALSLGGDRIEALELPLGDWRQFCRLTRLLVAGPTTFEITGEEPDQRLKIPLLRADAVDQAQSASALEGLIARAEELLDLAGVSGFITTLPGLLVGAATIDVMHRCAVGELDLPIGFTLGLPAAEMEGIELVILRLLRASVGDVTLALLERLTFIGTNVEGRIEFVEKVRDVASVEEIAANEDLDALGRRRIDELGAHGIMLMVAESEQGGDESADGPDDNPESGDCGLC